MPTNTAPNRNRYLSPEELRAKTIRRRTLNVIRSCKTPGHLKVAERYAELAMRQIKDDQFYIAAKWAVHVQFTKMKNAARKAARKEGIQC
jgi:hypothetical protein